MDNYNGNICFIISILLFLFTSFFLADTTRWSLTLVKSFYRSMAVMEVETNKTNVTHSYKRQFDFLCWNCRYQDAALCTEVMRGNCFSTQSKQYHFINSFLTYTIGSVGKTSRHLSLLKIMGGAFFSITNL